MARPFPVTVHVFVYTKSAEDAVIEAEEIAKNAEGWVESWAEIDEARDSEPYRDDPGYFDDDEKGGA